MRPQFLIRTVLEARWQLRRANLVESELFRIYSIYERLNRGVGAGQRRRAVPICAGPGDDSLEEPDRGSYFPTLQLIAAASMSFQLASSQKAACPMNR